MKKNLLILLPLLLTACASTDPSASTIEEDKDVFHNEALSDDIPADNYRNFYEIFVPSYCDSDHDGIGDLNGITSKLPVLKDLGYTGIWLTPIFTSPSYHKYDVKDYFSIDPSFGTMENLKNLVKEAHKNNIKVILDAVFNHTSDRNSWFQEALLAKRKEVNGESLSEKEEEAKSLYVFYDNEQDALASGMKYSKAGGNDFYYECNFSADMPELNFNSDVTYEKIHSILDYYLDDSIGVDGFRLDAVKYYVLGNAEKNIEILSGIQDYVHKKKKDAYLVGECYDTEKTIEKYYDSGLDSFFYFPSGGPNSFLTSSSNNEGRLKGIYYRSALAMEEECKSGIPAPFLNNHDLPRTSFSANYLSQNKFTFGLLGMLKGTTFHYYGDEIGMSSSNLPSGDYQDSNYRTHYYWNDETHEGECKDVIHSIPQEESLPAYATQIQDPDSLVNYIKELNHVRNTYPFLSRGTMVDALDEYDTSLYNNPKANLLPLLKEYEGKRYKLLFNFSSKNEEDYPLPSSYQVKYVLHAGKEKARLTGRTLCLPSYAIAILSEEKGE